MSFFSYALGALILDPGAAAPGPGAPGAAGLPAPPPRRHRRHRPLRDVLLRGQPPRLVRRLAAGCSGTLVVGALGLGVLRGLSMRVWAGNGWVLRQGNAITMALWLVSLLVHFAGDDGQSHAGAAGLEGASFLLYLGVTLCVQYYVVYRRALPLWAELGPDAGRPLRCSSCRRPVRSSPASWAGRLGAGPGRRRDAAAAAAPSGQGGGAATPTIPTSSTPRWSRTTTTTARPSCTHPADVSYTRRP